MAQDNQPTNQSTSSNETRTFDKELNKDVNDFHLPANSWTKARNAINNSKTGDLGKLGNEPGNQFCVQAPYTIISAIHLESDRWLIYSTNNIDSEIGIFTEDTCTYTLLVNDPCLDFNTKDLVIGTSKPSSDCTIDAYWEDNSRNPTRFIRVNNTVPYDTFVPYIQLCTDSTGTSQTSPGVWSIGHPIGCITCVPFLDANNLKVLDCNKIRLAPLVTPPCFRLEKGINGGTLLNGSYFVVAAYMVNQLKVTDYSVPSNVQALFSHDNGSGSLDIFVDFTDTRFDEYELILVSTVNQQTVARRLGIYSTHQAKISIDMENNTWITIPIENISLMNPIVEKADAMFSVQDYLLRVGPTYKQDFNYQPFANQIVTKWQSVQYPADYYRKGGNNTGHLRDEVYAFFIRWVYDTGDRSSVYHIPGRPKLISGTDSANSGDYIVGYDVINERWNAENTAIITSIIPQPVMADGGQVIAEGYMGYWESSELYPDDKPQIYNSATNPFLIFGSNNYNVTVSPYPGTSPIGYDLCGTPLRHHKMPDNALHSNTYHFDTGGQNIRILGLAFENIKPPLDNEGNLIPEIIGYEILRGSRQGNKSIIAKGIMNNMGEYVIQGNITPRTGAYVNYPYNDVNPDPFLHTGLTPVGDVTNYVPTSPILSNILNVLPQNRFSDTGLNSTDHLYSFHSPDTNFTHPFLSIKEVKCYGTYTGTVTGKFEYSEKHPKHKLISDTTFGLALVVGLGTAIMAMMGDKKKIHTQPYWPGSDPGPLINPIALAAEALLEVAYDATVSTPVIGLLALNDIAKGLGADILSALIGNPFGLNADDLTNDAIDTAGTLVTAMTHGIDTTETTITSWGSAPLISRVFTATPTFLYYLSEGADSTLRLIKNTLTYRDFALKYNSSCFYDTFSSPVDHRRELQTSNYIGPNIQDFGVGPSNQGYRINNQFRSDFVALELMQGHGMKPIINLDDSRYQTQVGKPLTKAYNANATFTSSPVVVDNPIRSAFKTTSTCAYVGLKQRIDNQYGQLNSIMQVPVTHCVEYIPSTTVVIPNIPIFLGKSSVMFNGDTYIGRYTEKNTFFYFYDWLFDQPDGYEFDYLKHTMLLTPTYWVNFDAYEMQDFGNTIMGNVPSSLNPFSWQGPNSFHSLDGYRSPGLTNLAVKYAWFYLFSSGVRDFFVESDINIDLRDWGNTDSERHYNSNNVGTISDVKTLFDTSIIKSRNYYKYDFSLSISKMYINYISWGSLQLTNYDPYLAETCYKYEPKRVIYSLPANLESKQDNWRIFLPLNFKDFISRVTCIKEINKSGAIIFFESDSPVEFQGTDHQPLDAKILTSKGWTTMEKITIEDKIAGRDGLFYNVLQVHPIKEKPVYKVIFKDKSYVRASDTHHWNVLEPKAREKVNLTYMKEKTKSTLDLKYDIHLRDAIVTPSPIEFDEKYFFISPYTLGVLIADGCITQTMPRINIDSKDIQILKRVQLESKTISRIGNKIDVRFKTKMSTLGLTRSGARRKDSNPFDKELKKYKLFGCKSGNKFIPEECLFGSIQQRVDLLRGLMDCDGSITNGKSRYSTTSIKLAKDIVKLLESLGGIGTIISVNKKNFSGNPIIEYTVNLQTNINPFYLSRKADKYKSRQRMILRTIENVEFDGIEKVRCITTDAPDNLYITDNYTLTHNTLQTTLGTKLTIGDGKLFEQPLQNISNTDKAYEYASCQNRLSVINTPMGAYWMSQNQGKIFSTSGGLHEISGEDLKWWFGQYLPYRLVLDFPDFDLLDNPVAGVGCQSIYDNLNGLLYFCKKDYVLRKDIADVVTYDLPTQTFLVNGILPVELGDPAYFYDASWTISYDPKIKGFLGFHDWHPDLLIPSKNTFLSVSKTSFDPIQNNSIWVHNERCDLYCNYYGYNFPFEVEFTVSTGQNVNTLRSVEYIMEIYKYAPNCYDRYHILNENFDEATVYNTEQCSGLLKLDLTPRNDLPLLLQYPIINLTNIQILYSKVENKYRFNAFWDITRERGGQDVGIPGTPSFAQQTIWDTPDNGYAKVLNANNMNYNKAELQRKKMRHYTTSVLLRKLVSGDRKMMVMLADIKNLNSSR